MAARQPDNRVKREDLKFWKFGGKLFVIHGSRGCPRNACIEEHDETLRCWACHKPLTERAAHYVRKNFVQTDNGAFIVDRGN